MTITIFPIGNWQDSAEFHTLVVGGVRDKRLKTEEYAVSVEVVDPMGKSMCLHREKTERREGAAGSFHASKGKVECNTLLYF